ncbi:hypothetical protein RHMOL_Rhmol01G0001400 [Rhododendron molle]|uniref:Uncharacterized protein n=1 Tax=Rhododendron molle TaxID=49168 RepID=A0ACC0PZ17_RHOML|nr:hypothetical protein RHMOL_Rhmol01G0001400 [Rhododendron molle]
MPKPVLVFSLVLEACTNVISLFVPMFSSCMFRQIDQSCSTISELADIRKPTNLSKLTDAALTTNMHSDVPVDYIVDCPRHAKFSITILPLNFR